MLSLESTATIQATLPAVRQALPVITKRFYATMFADNPDLLTNLFNRGNQAGGEQSQALAGSIAAFAALLVDRPDERPDAMLSRIAHKHASLGVTPDQYLVVHKYLFAAIADVLGEAVTPEVGAAWDEVYWLMAGALIALEARLRPETGDTWLRATVLERRTETPDTVSFVLRPPLPLAFAPGQYVSVGVTLPDGARQIRQYSLSRAPERGDWRITVKRVRGTGAGSGDEVPGRPRDDEATEPRPDGEVSGWLHDNLRAGDELTVSAPYGDLTLAPGDAPLLLASAGIGVTPMLSMLDHLVATGSRRRVTVVHADRSPADHVHREELRRLVAKLPGAVLHRWYEEVGTCSCDPAPRAGRADLSVIDLPDGLVAYLCGPLAFMRSVRTDLLRRGVPARDVHYEVFGPDLWLGQD